MAEGAVASSGLAWRLLATLEGSTIILAASALLAYTARSKVLKKRCQRIVNSVLITDVRNPLGQNIKQSLEAHGCIVHTIDAVSVTSVIQVDAIVVIGADRSPGLDGISNLVTEDVHSNLNLLESLIHLVKRGGCIAWACVGTSGDTFDLTNVAYDAVLRSSLQHIAKLSRCEPVWVGRCETVEQTTDKILSALLACSIQSNIGFSMRNAADKISKFLDRWWKIIT